MIESARLARTADGTPYSEIYGDVYHTSAGGLGQAHHVFLAGNGLPQRWEVAHHPRARFVIVETGFGMGLNFLATWAAWRNTPARCEYLHYVSVEKHPFPREALIELHAAWPALSPLADELCRQWPPLVQGHHRLRFDEGRVTLDLVFDDAAAQLPHWRFKADAFFLDGFSPAKNPGLWDNSLLAALSRLALPGATLATWSVAGAVREALSASGWAVEKVPGFAGKREMLRGTMRAITTPPESPSSLEKRVLVLGAGLAGSTAANRLAARGWQVTLVDALGGPGEGASGNRAGVLRPLPSRDDNVLARITRAGFLATSRHLQALENSGAATETLWDRCGVLHLARDATHEETQRRVVETQCPPADYLRFVGRDEARSLCAWPVDAGGWWFPGGAWVSPAAYCRANLRQHAARIEAHFGIDIARIAHDGSEWAAIGADGQHVASAPQLVVANAADARRLLGDWLPVFPARGQVSHLPAQDASPPRCVVCRLGYVTPAIGGERYAGATFLMRDSDPAPRISDHADNLAKLDFMLPSFSAGLCADHLSGRVGFRPASPDRLPIVGAVPRLGEALAPPGLWLVNGFGARGIVWSALAGELLADAMDGSPPPLASHLADALAPGRFLDRPRGRARKG